MNIAVAHTPVVADIAANGQTVKNAMRQAAGQNCRLIQFPEGALSGYCKAQIKTWGGFDWKLLQKELGEICTLANELEVWVVLGCAHQENDQLPRNSLYVISDKGDMYARYDKQILSHGERQGWYSSFGEKAVTFAIDGITFGLALCIEVQFYEIFDRYRQLGADAVLLSAYDNNPMFEITARAHASLNNFWVGLSTPANIERPLVSSLIGPDGFVQAQAKARLAVGAIDLSDPRWDIPLNKAKPWRATVRADNSIALSEEV